MEYDVTDKARKRVKKIKRFYYHAGAVGILGAFFFLMNMATSPFDMWWFFPMIPLTAILAFHYLFVFGIPGTKVLSAEWEEEEYERQLDKLSDEDYDFLDSNVQKGLHLEYTELSPEESLELREIQSRKSGEAYFSEGLG